MTYAVTTTHHASAERQSRADRVALRCGVPRIPRQSTLPGTFELAGVDVLYVVAQSRDVLVHRSGESITITPGLLKTRLHNGLKHPYIRAIAPDGVLPDVVFDGTLGLALDALHLAGPAFASREARRARPSTACSRRGCPDSPADRSQPPQLQLAFTPPRDAPPRSCPHGAPTASMSWCCPRCSRVLARRLPGTRSSGRSR